MFGIVFLSGILNAIMNFKIADTKNRREKLDM